MFVLFVSTGFHAVLGAETLVLSGNPGLDLMRTSTLADSVQTTSGMQKKSGPYATLASALFPGAGQAYLGNWWRAAAFFTAEVVGVTATLVYTNAGNKQTTYFQNYADWNIDQTGTEYHARWDVVKYAEWVNAYVLQMHIDSAQISISSDGTQKPWDRVNWQQMNTLEKRIGDFNASTGFSHTLPKHGDQQYYEEIGKYPQYGHGWDDANALDLTNSEVRTEHLLYYSAERGKANNLFAAATWATVGILLNHIVSAIEAATSAHTYNKTVQLGFRPENLADGTFGLRPTVDFRIVF